MDNELHAIDGRHRIRRIALVSGGHVGALLSKLDDLFIVEEYAKVLTISMPYLPPVSLRGLNDRQRKRSRGGGDYDVRGRRRI